MFWSAAKIIKMVLCPNIYGSKSILNLLIYWQDQKLEFYVTVCQVTNLLENPNRNTLATVL